ncbi:uncharacterized protein DNG_04256 [Cephalotrichum gorgonifer]|uniref:WW domain-containing protein n=1 Tax=Cephalotrichum gorgonifer TaxID=2041049 RepID=A0AAE8MXR2_9PEZI|nr:uncharacterized protein DNG_04256 [Cephalotrichum gorgonifer]
MDSEPFAPPPTPPRSSPSAIYRPLSDDDEIRLLLLSPARSLEAPISCSLHHTLLSTAPRFEAISYCWGTKGTSEDILLDGRPFRVYENAQAALRRLRLPTEPRWLWMDAICINQEDYGEKNVYVPLMGNVYERAEQVLIWLGEAGNPMLRRVLSTIKPGRSDDENEIAFAKEIRLDSEPKLHNNPLSKHVSWFGIHKSYLIEEVRYGEIRELLSRPWWTRVWIIQEVVVAKKLLFVCGSETFHWDTMRLMIHSSRKDIALGDTFNIRRCPEEPALHARFHRIDQLRTAWVDRRRDIRLINVLFAFRELHTTDPRDPRTIIEHTKSLDILSCVREWKGVGRQPQQTFAYSYFDQTKYHDINCWVKQDHVRKPRRGWARLPPGWERISQGDSSCYYYDHNNGTKYDDSPLVNLPPQRAYHPAEFRICPDGWSKTWDNLGRSNVSYEPRKTPHAGNQQRPVLASDLDPQDGLLSLPSWVPNWALKTHLDSELLLSWSHTGDSRYNAAGNAQTAVYTLPDARTLGLEGVHFDQIAVMAAAWHPESFAGPTLRPAGDLRESWVPLVTATPPNCPYRHLVGGREEAMLRTHIADYAGIFAMPSAHLKMVGHWFNVKKKYSEGPDMSSLANMRTRSTLSVVGRVIWQTFKTQIMDFEGDWDELYPEDFVMVAMKRWSHAVPR